MTKMDGSGKGGVAVAIHDQLGIAPRYLGTGEEPEQFALFNKAKFVEEML
jgi:fused signal recognition particle receptor